ncbi:signal peptidase I [Candidatus Shikimatogenerans silvanidophilus]|uniref:signal peptidase I n=1 Tax=Candidatus Shikimatogenerans silvanidophilus TaxID=2782547 RepID=UPI001BA81CD8|nr:signal peptidase I [Candidatus Shikimatogenerans silvanidophilus]
MFFNINYFLFFILFNIFYFLVTYNIYKKIGVKPCKSIIPIYNIIIIFKKNNKPIFLTFFFFIPGLFVIMYFILIYSISKLFFNKKYILLTLFTLGGYLYYINFNKKKLKDLKLIKKSKNKLYNYFYIILISIFIQLYFIQFFFIPTSSMENTIMVGDFIIVNKFIYGLRIPITTIQLPFFFKKIPIIGIPSYLNNFNIPYLRIKYKKIKINDLVTFNKPLNIYDNKKIINFLNNKKNISIDKRDNYIKRCVAIPGDIINIKKGLLYINNKLEKYNNFKKRKYLYYIYSNFNFNLSYYLKKFNKKFFKVKKNFYYCFLNEKEKIKIINNNIKIKRVINNNNNNNKDNYKKIKIPKKGDIILINNKNWFLYKNILLFEKNFLSFKELKKINYFIKYKKKFFYLVKSNYYFFIGDNWNKSFDSRFFGLISEIYIVGKPIIVIMNINFYKIFKNLNFFNIIKFNRFFKILY